MTNIFSILCLAMVVGRFASISATNYCKIESCTRLHEIHTMCKYTSSQPSASCTDWTKQGLTDSEKKIIVDKHNELRQKVASDQETRGNPGPQPAAVSMPNLQWDNELELIAQRWANQCDFNHDKCRNVERFQVDQIISITPSSDNKPLDLKDVVQRFSTSTAHYSQVIRAKTKLIGCGRMTFKNSKGWTAHYIVCNYGPAGNFPGEKDMRFSNKTIQCKLSNLQSSDMKKNKKDKYKQHVSSLYQYNRITVNEKKDLNIFLSK